MTESRLPFAWLWQNAPMLEDGCFNFFDSEARAVAVRAEHGGWVTPVFERTSIIEKPEETMKEVWRHVDCWRPGPVLELPPWRAAALRRHFATEEYRHDHGRHPVEEKIRIDENQEAE